MLHVTHSTLGRLFQVVGLLLLVEGLLYGQSLNSKLSQKASFVPKSRSPLEQLIEVARHYQIAMGIEWIDEGGQQASTLERNNTRTVQDLVRAILRPSPGYRLRIDRGVLHISNRAFLTDARNFLNVRIPEFKVKEANIYDANWSLSLGIKIRLHPELYAKGWNGGYGYNPGGVFDVHNITFSGRNLSVRQILNGIAAANGNALWVVRLDPSRMMKTEPAFFAQESDNEDFRWQFIPLQEDN
jgi:hypothetical protein